MEKCVLVKKFFTNGQKISFSLWAEVEKAVWVETFDSLVKKKNSVSVVCKKSDADNLSGIWKDPSLLIFLKRGTSVNSAS